ncbi:hypothetical protein K8W93_002495, partial [Salmonella enterica]|nr:hypothetical protein [Salmonella enterica]
MANIVTCKTKNGETVQYVDEVIGSGSMKDVYFSPDKSYVVAFYQKPQNEGNDSNLLIVFYVQIMPDD